MTRRLGEILIDDGLLDRAQLDEALDAQRRLGGSLGTRLLALGMIDEDALARTLSRIFDVPAASRADLIAAPPEVVALLSADFARRSRALPFGVEGEHLFLALASPSDADAIHEAEFLTGFVVAAHVTPDAVLRAALAHHHGIDEELGPAPPGKTAAHGAATGDETGAGAAGARARLAGVAQRLLAATTRDAVVAIAADALAELLPRRLVFAPRGEAWAVVDGGGFTLPAPGQAVVRSDEFSVLSPALERRVVYGPAAPSSANRALYDALGASPPGAAVVAPVVVRGRTLLILYADDPQGASPAPDLDEVKRLTSMLACALEIVILRGKIRREGDEP